MPKTIDLGAENNPPVANIKNEMINTFTKEEAKVVRAALRAAIDLHKKYVRPDMAKAYANEKSYGRKAKRIKAELPLLQSALKKLK